MTKPTRRDSQQPLKALRQSSVFSISLGEENDFESEEDEPVWAQTQTTTQQSAGGSSKYANYNPTLLTFTEAMPWVSSWRVFRHLPVGLFEMLSSSCFLFAGIFALIVPVFLGMSAGPEHIFWLRGTTELSTYNRTDVWTNQPIGPTAIDGHAPVGDLIFSGNYSEQYTYGLAFGKSCTCNSTTWTYNSYASFIDATSGTWNETQLTATPITNRTGNCGAQDGDGESLTQVVDSLTDCTDFVGCVAAGPNVLFNLSLSSPPSLCNSYNSARSMMWTALGLSVAGTLMLIPCLFQTKSAAILVVLAGSIAWRVILLLLWIAVCACIIGSLVAIDKLRSQLNTQLKAEKPPAAWDPYFSERNMTSPAPQYAFGDVYWTAVVALIFSLWISFWVGRLALKPGKWFRVFSFDKMEIDDRRVANVSLRF